jgi:hypothetical protein
MRCSIVCSRDTQTIGDTEYGRKKHSPGYRLLTEEQLLKLPVHNFLRLMRKVQAYRSYIYHHFGNRCCNTCHKYIGKDWYDDVGQYLIVHDDYLRLLKKVSKQLPSVEVGNKLKNKKK